MILPTIAEAARRIHAGQTTPSKLLEQCLANIDRFEERIQAWVLVDEQGARHAAEALAREKPRSALHGIPLGIKDLIDVAGMPTEAGSPLRTGCVAAADAPLVAALRRAGAIILGKTVTVEFACFDPSPTHNPWNFAHTPGGSSSGSAAAVAVGMCPGAVGTQTGGSLVRPSSYCGITTCKPTFGRISVDGVVPVSYHLDHPGPMARRVADLAVMLEFLSESELEPTTAHEPTSLAGLADWAVAVDAGALPPPRLGVVRQFFAEQADEAVGGAFERTLEKLRGAGAELVAVSYDEGFDDVQTMHRRIMAAEAAAYHRRDFRDRRESYGPMITELLDQGLALPAVEYVEALAWQRRFRRRVPAILKGVDAVIIPSTHTTAPATRLHTGTPLFQAPWSMSGLPVVSMPCAVADDGLPVAVQLVARHYQEKALFRAALWCEQAIGFDRVPPMVESA